MYAQLLSKFVLDNTTLDVGDGDFEYIVNVLDEDIFKINILNYWPISNKKVPLGVVT